MSTGRESSQLPGGRSDIQLVSEQLDGFMQNLCDKLYSSFEPLLDITSNFTPHLGEFDSSLCPSVADLHIDDALELDLVSTAARIDVLLKHMADAQMLAERIEHSHGEEITIEETIQQFHEDYYSLLDPVGNAERMEE